MVCIFQPSFPCFKISNHPSFFNAGFGSVAGRFHVSFLFFSVFLLPFISFFCPPFFLFFFPFLFIWVAGLYVDIRGIVEAYKDGEVVEPFK